MKKLTVAMVLTLALVMTGCMGGGLSKNQDAEIRLTLDAYIENFKKLDSKAMAQLYTYPATVYVVYDDSTYTLFTPHQGEYFYEKMWGFDTLRTWYNIEDVKMTVVSINSGDMATVKAVLSVTATEKGFPNEVYNLKTEHEFVMRKVGSTWKIASEKILHLGGYID